MIVVSVVAAVLVALLLAAVAQPVNPDCFEACDIGQIVAMGAIALVALLWLLLVLAMAWRLHRREPALATLSALSAAAFVAAMAGLDTSLWISPASYDSPIFVFDQLILVLAMGVQLPAISRLGAAASSAGVGRAATLVAALATLAVAFAFVVLGTTPFDSGPQVQFVAYLAFSADITVLAGASWRRAGRERIGLVLLGGAALFYAVIGSYYELSPFDSTPILLAATPIMALGWLWIGTAWLRSPQATAAFGNG
jgi:hypothetical protein